jgi:sulfite reductase alpha subunit-like flavoprotein
MGNAGHNNQATEQESPMSHMIVTYTVKPGREPENAALVRNVFEELAKARLVGFRYAVFQAADSGEFVHLYTNEGAAPGALQQLPAFQAFVADAADRHEQPATVKGFELIGAYRTFDDPDHLTPAGAPVPVAARAAGEARSAHTDRETEL